MTCEELGGACKEEFIAATFEEIAKLSQAHGKEMFAKGDVPHIQAMNKMMELMHNPEEMEAWMESKRSLFDNKPSI